MTREQLEAIMFTATDMGGQVWKVVEIDAVLALLAQTPDPRDVRHLSREEIIEEVTQNRMFVEGLGRREAQTPDAPPTETQWEQSERDARMLASAPTKETPAMADDTLSKIMATIDQLVMESVRNDQIITLDGHYDPTRVAFVRGEQSMGRQIWIECEKLRAAVTQEKD